MIPTPIFPAWRRAWSESPETLALAARADDALTRRNRGRQEVPEDVESDFLRAVVDLEHYVGHAPCDEDEPRAFRLALYRTAIDRLRPLVAAARWVRWLHLEQALGVASRAGDLLSSALVLRSLIEELNSLLTLQHYEDRGAADWERGKRAQIPDRDSCDLMRNYCVFLLHRVLPMTRHPGREALLVERPVEQTDYPGHDRLLAVFNSLNDYVHPNYGSHYLCLFPDRAEAGKVLLGAVTTIYELFFSLRWAEEEATVRYHPEPPVCQPGPTEWRRFVENELPRLGQRASEWRYDPSGWPVPLGRFDERVREEAEQDDVWAAQLATPGAPELDGFRLRTLSSLSPLIRALTGAKVLEAAETIGQLRLHLGLGLSSTLTGCVCLAQARETADRLEQVCRDLPPGERFPTSPPYDRWIRFVGDSVALWTGVIGIKMENLRLAVARMINARNPLGAVICARSLLEHWAVAADLSRRFRKQWAKVEKAASDGRDPGPTLSLLEQEIARFLTGTKGTSEAASLWRERLAGTPSQGTTAWHINLRTAVKESLPSERDVLGYLYDLFSRVIHGDCFTGGDLLPGVTPDNPDKLLLKALMVLARFENTGWVMASSSGLLRTTMRLHRPGGTSEATGAADLRDVMRRGRLPDRLVEGRDVFGRGALEDPYTFRSDLDYHDAFCSFCESRVIPTDNRRLWGNRGLVAIDVVRTPDGGDLYFAHDLGPFLNRVSGNCDSDGVESGRPGPDGPTGPSSE